MAAPPIPIPLRNDAERRQFPRYNVALDVSFGPLRRGANGSAAPSGETASAAPAQKLQRTFSVNLSLGGLCVYSDVVYPIGTELWCAVTVPGRPRPVEAVGMLAWFQRVDQESHGYKLGIEFSGISRETQAALQALFDQPPAAAASRSKRLLLVDDDEELCLALKLRFESSGFQVITAANGVEALRKGREERPHLIILDLMLPQLNGYEVCRLLKFDQKFQHIPIILCTARCRREDRELGTTVGADAYVTKPFNGQDLIAKVEELLNVSHA